MEEHVQIFRTEEEPIHDHDEDAYDTDFMGVGRLTIPPEIDSVSDREHMEGHSHSYIEEEPSHDHDRRENDDTESVHESENIEEQGGRSVVTNTSDNENDEDNSVDSLCVPAVVPAVY
jgi:hypothetical protein